MLYIYWFRKDLRLADNRGLHEFLKAVGSEKKFVFLYIKNRNTYNYFGRRRIAFLYECLSELRQSLDTHGFKLATGYGNSIEVFSKIASEHKKFQIYCNDQVEPYSVKRDQETEKISQVNGGKFKAFNDSTIFGRGEIKNALGKSYKVYTAFRNQARGMLTEQRLRNYEIDFSILDKKNETIPECLRHFSDDGQADFVCSDKMLRGGISEGNRLLKEFAASKMEKYKTQRDCPDIEGTSMLSAHLHFGTVSVREVFRTALDKLGDIVSEDKRTGIETWINELLWREFYYDIAYNNPSLVSNSFHKEYDKVKWNYDDKKFSAWCEGKTGYPIVDAGMRQLNLEGWMHNRLRMITAMFLTKDLLIDWRMGEKYFAENLIDLDFSNNNGGWQWCASTGADAQPYFRIFNPALQSRKFDPHGNFIKKYVPELTKVDIKHIHEPHLMSPAEQEISEVRIGKDYPLPIVDHKKARIEAIRRFKEVTGGF